MVASCGLEEVVVVDFGASGRNGGRNSMGIVGDGVAQETSVFTGFGLIFGVFGKVLDLNIGREEVEVVMLVVESNSLVDVWKLQRKHTIACNYEQRIFHVMAVVRIC
ncbi:Hypothetical predicted protein [Olea europaea subsp. europaea]|uniref:Uncharacterized protein n=1 Tax=Olea europaea subsp. europaea TaxID=158383 RepID=A0A8S0PF21_OLEEU|nr:Hypothetical predicted protein [Olea europaea subsp. europaea]